MNEIKRTFELGMNDIISEPKINLCEKIQEQHVNMYTPCYYCDKKQNPHCDRYTNHIRNQLIRLFI